MKIEYIVLYVNDLEAVKEFFVNAGQTVMQKVEKRRY